MDGCDDRVVFNRWTIDFQGLTDRQTLRAFNVCVFGFCFLLPETRTVAMFRKTHVTRAWWNIVAGAQHRLHITESCMLNQVPR